MVLLVSLGYCVLCTGPSFTALKVRKPRLTSVLQAWLTFGTNATGFNKLFPNLDVRLLTLKINFKSPLWRNYLLLHGVCK